MAPDFPVRQVTRDPIEVMFLATTDNVDAFGPLWETLEGIVGLKGRKFYGAFFAGADLYHVCVLRAESDDPAALGLESEVLPGGLFLRHRLRGAAPAIYDHIGPSFLRLSGLAKVDPSRPGIEFYRSQGEIDCLLPIT